MHAPSPADTADPALFTPAEGADRRAGFDTPLTLWGPLRQPRQMLADQSYGGHASIHDDAMASRLGLRAGPIEGPTHFSQFVPALARLWGRAWFERGVFSCHFLNMVVEGESVRAGVDLPAPGARSTRCRAEKADGTPVLEASASLCGAGGVPGADAAPTLLAERLARQRPPGPLVILADLRVGQRGAAPEAVAMGATQHMGDLYPFSLADKLRAITEPSPWYDQADNPWGRPIIPLEMVSVLAEHSAHQAGFAVKGPAVGLFADLEVRMVEGPLFVGEPYTLQREIVSLAQTPRTESYWVRTRIIGADGRCKAEVLLNHAVLKHSYAAYAAEAEALQRASGG